LQKVVTIVAALALGSACISNDALARGGGGGDDGGGFAGRHMDGLPIRRTGRDFHASASGGNSPNTHGYNCWKSQGIPTNPAWRQRHAEDGTCY
jgi:hypothetical protein